MNQLFALLNEPKDSSTIHFDEDTIPHGACDDQIHCDCMCPKCWQLKVNIITHAAVFVHQCRNPSHSHENCQEAALCIKNSDNEHPTYGCNIDRSPIF